MRRSPRIPPPVHRLAAVAALGLVLAAGCAGCSGSTGNGSHGSAAGGAGSAGSVGSAGSAGSTGSLGSAGSVGGAGSAGSVGSTGSTDAGSGSAVSAEGATSGTGFDGGLLPAGLPPHDFTLTDQSGQRVALSDLRGRVVILAFLYSTSPTTAPLIAEQIRGALDELAPAPGVSALAVSVDPAADTPAHVRAFLRETSLSGRLRYLTGRPAQLHAVWRAYRVVPASAGAQAYERGAFVLLLDKTGAARVDFSLEELTPEVLAHDVRKLQSM